MEQNVNYGTFHDCGTSLGVDGPRSLKQPAPCVGCCRLVSFPVVCAVAVVLFCYDSTITNSSLLRALGFSRGIPDKLPGEGLQDQKV